MTAQPPPPLEPSPGPGSAPEADPASQSLAEALRLSFRLLSVIMVLVLAAFLITGFAQVEPGQRGVRLLFGAVQGKGDDRVLKPGLHWAWPAPVGRVVKVDTGKQVLALNDFWFQENPEDATKTLDELRPPELGLRPGYDGALLTGDRGLIHVKLNCLYSIASRRDGPDPQAVLDFLQNVRDPQETVRAAVCAAAIRAAAARTVDSIYPTGTKDFADAVQVLAQEELRRIRSGLQIAEIQVPKSTVPLAARAAFNAVNAAAQERDRKINQARGQENRILATAAGESWKKLLGSARGHSPRTPPAGAAETAPATSPALAGDRLSLVERYFRARQSGDEKQTQRLQEEVFRYGLLPLYAAARERGRKDLAEALLSEIYQVLESRQTTGEAAKILDSARAYRSTIVQRTRSRAEQFAKLIDKYRATPDLMLAQWWDITKKEILNNPTNTKYYLTEGQKTVLRLNPDPAVRRRILRQKLQAERSARQRHSQP